MLTGPPPKFHGTRDILLDRFTRAPLAAAFVVRYWHRVHLARPQ